MDESHDNNHPTPSPPPTLAPLLPVNLSVAPELATSLTPVHIFVNTEGVAVHSNHLQPPCCNSPPPSPSTVCLLNLLAVNRQGTSFHIYSIEESLHAHRSLVFTLFNIY